MVQVRNVRGHLGKQGRGIGIKATRKRVCGTGEAPYENSYGESTPHKENSTLD
jgi:hypothetical protein